jgi:hypothetical protein
MRSDWSLQAGVAVNLLISCCDPGRRSGLTCLCITDTGCYARPGLLCCGNQRQPAPGVGETLFAELVEGDVIASGEPEPK